MTLKRFEVREYPAWAVRVVDGDSVIFLIDTGFHQAIAIRGRLENIDAPELRGETLAAGRAAREYLRGLLFDAADTARPCWVRARKDASDKYGRWIVRPFVITEQGEIDVCRSMVITGHATEHFYRAVNE